MKQIFDEEYFKKLDELVEFRIEKDWDKIHLVSNNPNDKYIIIHKKRKIPSDKPDSYGRISIPSKLVVELVKSERYNIKYPIAQDCLKFVTALWGIKDAVGKPYIKHWLQLIAFYKDQNLKSPLKYTGDGNFRNTFYKEPDTRDWHYKMANALLGLEEHNDVLLKFFGTKQEIVSKCIDLNISVPEAIKKLSD